MQDSIPSAAIETPQVREAKYNSHNSMALETKLATEQAS